jgi:hypothetical protein
VKRFAVRASTRFVHKLALIGLLLLPAPLLMGASRPHVTHPHVTQSHVTRSHTTRSRATAPTPYPNPNPSPTPNQPTGLMGTNLILRHAPQGSVTAQWTASSGSLAVTIRMEGLTPNGTYAADLAQGYCGSGMYGSNGTSMYMLSSFRANSTGSAVGTSTIKNMTFGLQQGMVVEVYDGARMMTSTSSNLLGCAFVTPGYGYGSSAFGGQNGTYGYQFGDQIGGGYFQPAPMMYGQYGGMGNNMNAAGTVTMYIQNSTLYVSIYASGLVPFSSHAAHIHTGSCSTQGGVLHMLRDVVADGSGNGTSFTAIAGVTSIPTTGWYINVHNGDSTQLGTQSGFEPILCANVR